MQLLNPNILNFNLPAVSTGNSVGTDRKAIVLFFTSAPTITDFQTMLDNSACATLASLGATPNGYINRSELNFGIKAIKGSIYEPSKGATRHFPVTYKLKKFGTVDMTAVEDSRKLAYCLKGSTPLNAWSGIVQETPLTTPDTRVLEMDLVYAKEITVDACLRNERVPENSNTIGFTVGGKAYSIPTGNVSLELADPFVGTTVPFVQTSGAGSIELATKGNAGNDIHTATLTHAVICMTTSSGPETTPEIVFGCEVGLTDSGNFIELDNVTLTTGEYPLITNFRTGTRL